MAVRPPSSDDVFISDIDYDVYDLDDIERPARGAQPYRAPSPIGRRNSLPDARFLIPLAVLLAALLLIFLACLLYTSDAADE